MPGVPGHAEGGRNSLSSCESCARMQLGTHPNCDSPCRTLLNSSSEADAKVHSFVDGRCRAELRHAAHVTDPHALKSHLPRLVLLAECTRSAALRRGARTSNATLGLTNPLAQRQRARAEHHRGTSTAD